MKKLLLILIILFSANSAFAEHTMFAELFVHAGDNPQIAINSAACTDTITVDANTTFQGAFNFPAKSCGANGPTIRTSAYASLPASGTRITSSNSALLAKFVTTVSGGITLSALNFPANSSGWTFLGIEVTTIASQPYAAVLVDLAPYTSFATAPSDIVFDRCYVHSLEDETTNPHASSRIAFNIIGSRITIKDSRVSMPAGYVGSSQVVDNQYAVLVGMGVDITLQNDFLGAWYNAFFTGGASFPTNNSATVISANLTHAVLSNTNNLHIGDLLAFQQSSTYWGAVKITNIVGTAIDYVAYSTSWGAEGTPLNGNPLIPGEAQWNGLLPTNFVIRRCTFYIDPSISAQIFNETGAFSKGYFEIKSMDGGLFEGNDFTGQTSNWAFTVRNQGTPTGAPSVWSTIKNVTLRSNRLINTGIPSSYRIIIMSLEDNYATSTPGGNILFENNLITGVGKMADVSGGDGVAFVHNTFVDNYGSSMVENIGVEVKNFVNKNNIVANNEYGVHCQSGDYSCFPNLFPSNMLGNVIVGVPIQYRPTCGNPYPVGNYCTDTYTNVKFTDPNALNFKLLPDSPFKNLGTDGLDPGINQDTLNSALNVGTRVCNWHTSPACTP